MTRLRNGCIVQLLILLVAGSRGLLTASPTARSDKSSAGTEVVISDAGWKLGSFPMGKGEEAGAYEVGFDDRDFRLVPVPAEIQLTLGLQGMDLYRQSKELSLINKKEWWYRRLFTLSPEQSEKRVRLEFDGVDYFATVWINGEKLGDHEGAYTGFSYDITSRVKRGAENVVAVRVTSPWLPKDRGLAEYMKGSFCLVWPGIVTVFSSPPHALSCSWNQIPANGNASFTMGLIRDVKLILSPAVSITDIFAYTQKLNPDGSAALAISGTVQNDAPADVRRTLEFDLRPQNFAGETRHLSHQMLQLHLGSNEFHLVATVKNPKLWWTWDTGSPNLYKLVAKLAGGSGEAGDQREATIGIRTIERKPDMSYWLNGRHLFLKGVWYPMGNYYLTRNTRISYETDLRLLRAANANYIISHTVMEKPDFYDLCDELGLMMMIQMPFNQPGPFYALEPSSPRREPFLKMAMEQGSAMVREHRNHPSIIVWSPLAESQWSQWAKYYAPLYDGMKQVVEREAPGTIYQRSYCDFGEEHLWRATAGYREEGSYQEFFDFSPAVVSEYGSDAISSYENLHKYLSTDEMWSEKNPRRAEWFYLPIDLDAYDYLAPWNAIVGFHSLLSWPYQMVDRDWRSPKELVEASQLYQALIMQYGSDAFRRKKYNPIQDVRWWEYKDHAPGFYGGFIDFDQVPKIAYYAYKRAMAQFTLSLAFKDQYEPQPGRTPIHIPVWVVNDYRNEIPLEVQSQVLDLSGREIYAQSLETTVGPDQSKAVDVLNWKIPEVPAPTVFAVRATARQQGGDLIASRTIYLKAVPKAGTPAVNGVPKLDKPCRLLLIGEKKYADSLAVHLRQLGVEVDKIDEEHLERFAELRQAEALRQKYDVIWLGPFEALWKVLDDDMADGMAQAVREGVSFIHTGSESSFHGGDSVGACLDMTHLAEVLPVVVHQSRNDLSLLNSSKDVRVLAAGWTDGGLKEEGIPSFNEVQAKEDSRVVMKFGDWPLLVSGRYGQGRTVAFMGYTPEGKDVQPTWLAVYAQILTEARGENPQYRYAGVGAGNKPLLQLLKEQPPTSVKASPEILAVTMHDNVGNAAVEITGGERWAHLVRLRMEWEDANRQPFLVLYGDNYFDLFPGEKKRVTMEFRTPGTFAGPAKGTLIVEGTNVPETRVPISLRF